MVYRALSAYKRICKNSQNKSFYDCSKNYLKNNMYIRITFVGLKYVKSQYILIFFHLFKVFRTLSDYKRICENSQNKSFHDCLKNYLKNNMYIKITFLG